MTVNVTKEWLLGESGTDGANANVGITGVGSGSPKYHSLPSTTTFPAGMVIQTSYMTDHNIKSHIVTTSSSPMTTVKESTSTQIPIYTTITPNFSYTSSKLLVHFHTSMVNHASDNELQLMISQTTSAADTTTWNTVNDVNRADNGSGLATGYSAYHRISGAAFFPTDFRIISMHEHVAGTSYHFRLYALRSSGSGRVVHSGGTYNFMVQEIYNPTITAPTRI